MQRTILFSIFLILSQVMLGQKYVQTITGTVMDKDSKETLVGATVLLLGSEPLNGTTTDVQGRFVLKNVGVGRQAVLVTFVGYQELLVPEILVTTGKVVNLAIELSQQIVNVEEVQIKASAVDKDKALNSMAAISARKLNMEDASRYAGGFYDASRMVSAFAGVTAVEGDGVNDIVIRGNSSRGLLWRLEGVEIPNPNHFTDGQGGTGGAVSIISSKMLATSDFFTGAFPAEYGNATAGIMDLNLRTGNTGPREYAFQLGVVGTEVSMEGGFKADGRSSFLVNYRYSTFGYLSKAGLIDLGNNNLPPVFHDFSTKLNFPTKKTGTFSFFAVAGQSNTGTEAIKDSLLWLTDNELSYYEREDHAMAVMGLSHFYLFPGNNTSIKTVLAGTYQSDEWSEGNLTTGYEKMQDYYSMFKYPSLRGSVLVNSKLNTRNTIRFGITQSWLGFDMFFTSIDPATSFQDTMVNQTGQSSMTQCFVQHKHRFSDRTEINLGLHYLYFHLNGTSSLEPRLGLKHKLNQKLTLNAGLGIHARAEAISAYMAQIKLANGQFLPVNQNLELGKSAHAIIGMDYQLNANWRIKTELYYQHLYHMAISADSTSHISSVNFGYGIPDQQLVNGGIGYNYGLEITLERFFNQGFYLLYTTSLFQSRFKAPNGHWYNTAYNGNYVGNILLGKDFQTGKNQQNVIGVNTRCVLRGGYRFSPIDEAMSQLQAEMVYDETRYNQDQLPAFLRFDAGAYLRINHETYSYVISCDIQNFINHKNTLGYEYDETGNTIMPVEGMGLVPILNFRIEF